MKREQTIRLFIVVLVTLLTAMPYIIITLRTSRPTTEYTWDNKSVASNIVDVNIKQNQSSIDEQTNISTEAPNIIHPKVCIEQWRQDLMSIEDTLHCIDNYKEDTKD